MPRRLGALIASSLSLFGGCLSSDPAVRPDDAALSECEGGRAEPLTIATTLRVLRRHGFTVNPDRTSGTCSAADIVADLTNIHFDGPYENIGLHDEVSQREGHVGCVVRRSAISGTALRKDLDAPPASPIFSGRVAEFYVANVECTIYPEGERTGAQIARLDAAMTEFERLVRP